MVIFFQVCQVLELMGHPIGPKFGQYLQLIDMKGNSGQIFEIFIFGRFRALLRSIFVHFWGSDQKIDLLWARNRPKMKISKIWPLFPFISINWRYWPNLGPIGWPISSKTWQNWKKKAKIWAFFIIWDFLYILRYPRYRG